MQAAREDVGHVVQRTSPGIPDAAMWDDGPMARTSYLVARLHVDLQRVASAVCPAL
jgi:hypothetical protein